MIHKEIIFGFNIYHDQSMLHPDDQEILFQAKLASNAAYAPYSNYKVGVAIRTTDLSVIKGSNQENGSFPIGQCAERIALYTLIHEHGRKPIDTIAITVDSEKQILPASPCGACRQMLNEYRAGQSNPARLLLASVYGNVIYEVCDIRDLLPLPFDGLFLGQ